MSGACPFGLVFRPKNSNAAQAPFATWAYRPGYLPQGVAIEFAEGVPLKEPELLYLPFLRRSGLPTHEPTDHSLAIRHVSGLTVGFPSAASLSAPSQAVVSAGLVNYYAAPEYVLELAFLGRGEEIYDLRPTLPLRFRGVVQNAA
jgi:hypothetical protein